MPKREDYISWDDYFMSIAKISAMRSKDPMTQVGACIVNNKNKILGIGYNGFPIGCSDDDLPWERNKEDVYNSKYSYSVHAERNAILNSHGNNLEGAKLYVLMFPCNECAKSIVQSGISEVVYLSDKYADQDIFKAAKRIFSLAGVKMRQFKSENSEFTISLREEDV